MNPRTNLLLPLALAVLAHASAPAGDLQQTVDLAIAEQQQGHDSEAVKHFEVVLKSNSLHVLTEADIRTRLGNAYRDLGRYFEAEQEQRRAAQLCRAFGSGGRSMLSAVLNNLGSLYLETHKLAQARQSLEESIQVWEEIEGPPYGMITPLNNLATVALNLGETRKAGDLYLRALALAGQEGDGNGRFTAEILHNLAALRFREGQFDESADALVEAVDALVQALGEDHPSIAIALTNLVTVRVKQGRMEEAESAAERARAILESRYDEDHPSLADLFDAYALVLGKTSRAKSAKQLRKKARAIRKESRDENMLDHTIDVSAFTNRH